ncbi:MAG: hypothetical protein ACK5LG_21860 [Bacteroides thetaiotaomicron]
MKVRMVIIQPVTIANAACPTVAPNVVRSNVQANPEVDAIKMTSMSESPTIYVELSWTGVDG